MKWLLFVPLLFLMPGCSTMEKRPQKTEPSVQAAEAHVKNAPYRVRGKRYIPMSVADALQYHETGYASWYGGKARRLKTSSGEYINPRRSMTAAHKTLPMPCKVKVTCLETGKSIVVRINTRGPFHSNRLIDLTTSAASRIGLHKRGVSRVRLEVISVGDGPYEVFAR
ncbi:septal ring lytic transglycosylase RlpA family protein [uncultured Akkermansia sp.]|uniref:septal ring lytic transglycosylase RlpA family protein n=1 Tax=uncultured Akkermansia sp. TaxID=512294 RepID=UPI00262FB9C8|nr:septal ring lytic transglycosylase RlpA family protein [uncultured Akkermansia sp.]